MSLNSGSEIDDRSLDSPQNPIFYETKRDPKATFLQKLRTFFWFYPDMLINLISKFRPISYIFVYGLIALILWQTNAAAIFSASLPEFAQPSQVLIEGVTGKISSLNPLRITHNQIERDLQELIFSKLVKISNDGVPRPDIARTWAVADDGKTYTFFLRSNIYWHDGVKMTADDVIFTFEAVQKMQGDDSYAKEFEKVKISKIDDYTVLFTLPQENSRFLGSLSVGIVPKHILENIDANDPTEELFNQYPVGTGPFMISENEISHVLLLRNDKYFKGAPRLSQIKYVFYPTEKDVLNDMRQYKVHTFVNPSADAVAEIKKYKVFNEFSKTIYLRSKLIYFNLRNKGPLSEESVREALSLATNREEIIKATGEPGKESLGPIIPQSWAFDGTIDRYRYNISRANKTLDAADWKYPGGTGGSGRYREKNGKQLIVTLTFLDGTINAKIAQVIKSQWADVGVNVILDTQTYQEISSETVPRREFESLLFELETTADPDKYNLWHSLKVDHPGLNLSGYKYDRVDILLERARKETNKENRKSDYSLFQKYIMRDMPALYLYHPAYTFIAHQNVKGIDLKDVVLPQDRYANIEQWYLAR